MGEKKERFQVWRVRKEKQEKQKLQFPKHWGDPPKIQTRDYRELPGEYGYGSSTLAKWIAKNLKKDEEAKNKDSPLGELDRVLKLKCQWHLLFLNNHTSNTQV
tara:strand:+ start:681 stop:989 length:309 start_codon:yes stop_codon:yes gene_type:complete